MKCLVLSCSRHRLRSGKNSLWVPQNWSKSCWVLQNQLGLQSILFCAEAQHGTWVLTPSSLFALWPPLQGKEGGDRCPADGLSGLRLSRKCMAGKEIKYILLKNHHCSSWPFGFYLLLIYWFFFLFVHIMSIAQADSACNPFVWNSPIGFVDGP